MKCQITGRPCCLGDQAECRIVSKEYCDFFKGVYHDEATLCSQVKLDNLYTCDIVLAFESSLSEFEHRIEINQSDSCENLSLSFNAHVRKFAILTRSWQVPPALLTFKRHLPVMKADVLLTFCTYIRKKPAVKIAGGTCQDGILMATMRCTRRQWKITEQNSEHLLKNVGILFSLT